MIQTIVIPKATNLDLSVRLPKAYVLIDAQSKRLPPSGLTFVGEVINDSFIVSFVSYIEKTIEIRQS